MVRDNPARSSACLLIPRGLRRCGPTSASGLSPQRRRQQALAAQSIAADNRAETLRRRQAEAQATAAAEDIIDATRAGNVPAAQDALARLRASGTGVYRTYEGIVNGTIQDIPTTPVMRAMVSPTGWPILATR